MTVPEAGVGYRGRRQARGRPAPGRVLLVASLGALLTVLDLTAAHVAIPSLQAAFPAASLGAISWVLTAYAIVFAALAVVLGRLADLVGRRRFFTAGTLVFTLSALWCALAPSLPLLVAGRALQAAGAAMLVPASLAIVLSAVPADRRVQAVTAWAGSGAAGAALGASLGGSLIGLGGWRWAFLTTVPFGVAALALAGRSLVESRSPDARGGTDVRAAVLLCGALALLVLGLVEGPERGWSSLLVVAAFVGAILLAGGLVATSRTHPRPLLDPGLLRLDSFPWGNAAIAIAGTGVFASLLANVLWLHHGWGYGPARTGLALVPGAAVAAVTAVALGRRRHRATAWLLPLAALVWSGAVAWYAVVLGPEPDFLRHWLPGQVLSGAGAGATLTLLGSATLAAVPVGRLAGASAVVSAGRHLGGVLGTAVVVGILSTRLGAVAGPGPRGGAGDLTASALTGLRPGWILAAACFTVVALVAVVAPLRHRDGAPDGPADEVEGRSSGTVRVHLPPPGAETPETQQALRPYPHGSYLDDLPASLRRRLEGAGTEVRLAAGEWLFREGDRAAVMYVVVAGRLEVLQDDVVIRELGPGSVLGELALLSGGDARSASVRARRDSVLSQVSRADFEAAMGQEPGASMAVATALARALQTRGQRQEAASSQARLVAVVGLSRSSPVAEVGRALEDLLRGLPRRLRVHATGAVRAEELARAERDNDRVVVVAPWPDEFERSAWWDACLRQADRVILVAHHEDDLPRAWETSGTVPDLVLVGGPAESDSVDLAPDLVADWCRVVRPDRVIGTSVHALRETLRPLAAAIGGCSLGLVLAGGGARAMAHIGVLHEFEAAGLVVDRLAGTSLGAVMAAAYATGRSAQDVEESTFAEFVRRNPFGDYALPTRSIAQGGRTEAALRRTFGAQTRIEALPRQFRCVSTDLLGRTPYIHRAGLLWEAVAASGRLPVFFPPFRHDGRLLVDGGVLDNLPVGLLTERDEGPLVAVNIGSSGSGRPADPARPPRIPGIGDTLFRTMTIGSAGAVERARAAGAFVISPPTLGVGLVDFHQMDRMVEAGRLAGRALLDATGGDLMAGR
ncbi:MFS transporter [Intrasporangium sp.]|uniref:MFS transporter n=1 Tax=Intrasporangium sp. TaxID=1925024 RepID=UPI00293B1C62|nr:MFS transporter [Intrasporangium sp.]MDV3221981.1 MFS transporter [Intrasporangium sp.]